MSRRSRRPSRPVVPAKHPRLAGWRWVKDERFPTRSELLSATQGDDRLYAVSLSPSYGGPASGWVQTQPDVPTIDNVRVQHASSETTVRRWAEQKLASHLEAKASVRRILSFLYLAHYTDDLPGHAAHALLWQRARTEGHCLVQAYLSPLSPVNDRSRRRAEAKLARILLVDSASDAFPSFLAGIGDGLLEAGLPPYHALLTALRTAGARYDPPPPVLAAVLRAVGPHPFPYRSALLRMRQNGSWPAAPAPSEETP